MGEPEPLSHQGTGRAGPEGGCRTAAQDPARTGPDGHSFPTERLFRVTRAALLYRFCFLLFLTAVGALLLAILAPMGIRSRDWLVLTLLGVWFLALLRYWAFFLSMPQSIRCGADRVLEFRSLFRTVRIPCSDVKEIKVSPFYPGYMKLLSSRRRGLLFLSHIDGLHELIGWIRRSNPSVRTRGC